MGQIISRLLRILAFSFFLFVGQLAFSQQQSAGVVAAFSFVDSIFQPTAFTFEINELCPSDSLLSIMIKLNNALASNKEWAAEYMNKNYKPGEGMPYNEKLGITKDEYDQIKTANESSYKLYKIRSEYLRVTKTNACIAFKSTDSFRILDYLLLYPDTKILTFGGDTVLFSGEINAPSGTPFGKWHGYSWQYEKSNQNTDADIDIHQLSAKIIEVDIGRTIPGNKIVLRIKY